MFQALPILRNTLLICAANANIQSFTGCNYTCSYIAHAVPTSSSITSATAQKRGEYKMQLAVTIHNAEYYDFSYMHKSVATWKSEVNHFQSRQFTLTIATHGESQNGDDWLAMRHGYGDRSFVQTSCKQHFTGPWTVRSLGSS